MCVHGSQAVDCTTELFLSVDKLRKKKTTTGKGRCQCTFCQLLKLRILTDEALKVPVLRSPQGSQYLVSCRSAFVMRWISEPTIREACLIKFISESASATVKVTVRVHGDPTKMYAYESNKWVWCPVSTSPRSAVRAHVRGVHGLRADRRAWSS